MFRRLLDAVSGGCPERVQGRAGWLREVAEKRSDGGTLRSPQRPCPPPAHTPLETAWLASAVPPASGARPELFLDVAADAAGRITTNERDVPLGVIAARTGVCCWTDQESRKHEVIPAVDLVRASPVASRLDPLVRDVRAADPAAHANRRKGHGNEHAICVCLRALRAPALVTLGSSAHGGPSRRG